MSGKKVFLTLILIILTLSQSYAANYPKRFKKQLNDCAEILSSADKAVIETKVNNLYDKTGIEMTVLTIKSLETYGTDKALFPFSCEIFTEWKVGEKNDRGILIVFCMKSEEITICRGPAYDDTLNKDVGHIIEDTKKTYFDGKNYSDGIKDATEKMITAIIDKTGFTVAGMWFPWHFNNLADTQLFYYIMIFIILVLYVIYIIFVLINKNQGWQMDLVIGTVSLVVMLAVISVFSQGEGGWGSKFFMVVMVIIAMILPGKRSRRHGKYGHYSRYDYVSERSWMGGSSRGGW